jgi:hypothetical protein
MRVNLAVTLALGVALLVTGVDPAQAGFIVNLDQVGPNVVATGSGTIDLAGLSLPFPNSFRAVMQPQFGQIAIGSPNDEPVDVYTGITGATSSFGPGNGGASFPNSGSGDKVFINPGMLLVPSGYVSGNPLSSISTYDNRTFSTLGVTPGTYLWTWGSGAHADSFTLNIGRTPVPEPASLMLLGVALVGLGLMRSWGRRQA